MPPTGWLLARGVRLEHTDQSRPALGMHRHRHAAPRLRNHPDPRGARVRRRTRPQVRPARRGTAGPPRGAAEGNRRRQAAGFPVADPRHSRARLARHRDPGRPAGSSRRDHRPDRTQDDHQRAQLGRQGVHGGLRRLDDAHLGQRRAGADQPARRRRPGASSSRAPKARPTSSTRRSRR